jgi:hypothetical protein
LPLGRERLQRRRPISIYPQASLWNHNVISPLVMAHGMKLHSVAVIFSMLFCVDAFGVLGVLVAAPLVAIVGILHDELYRERFLPTVTDADLDCLAQNDYLDSQVPLPLTGFIRRCFFLGLDIFRLFILVSITQPNRFNKNKKSGPTQ